jgi:hypothetical protein
VSFRRQLDFAGLSSPVVHMELVALQRDLPRSLDIAATLGATEIIVPHLSTSDRLETRGDWARLGQALAKLAGDRRRAASPLAGQIMAMSMAGLTTQRCR